MRNPTKDNAMASAISIPMKSKNSVSPHHFSDLMAELLQRGNSVRFRANGKSMAPIIQCGEAITVEPVVPSAVKRGEIILYRSDRGVIAHRVVQVSRPQVGAFKGSNGRTGDDWAFRLRGDASSSCDEPVEARQVLGRVILVERSGRAINLTGGSAQILQRLRVFICRLRRAVRRQLSTAAAALIFRQWKVALELNPNLTPGPRSLDVVGDKINVW